MDRIRVIPFDPRHPCSIVFSQLSFSFLQGMGSNDSGSQAKVTKESSMNDECQILLILFIPSILMSSL